MSEVYEKLRRIKEELPELPSIWGVEISGEEIIMMAGPDNRHEFITRRVRVQLDQQIDAESGLVAHMGPEIENAGLGKSRKPDVLVLSEQALLRAGNSVQAEDVELVLEVVSASNPENDYTGKIRDYAAMNIPWYVIIDPRDGTGLTQSLPEAKGDASSYRSTTRFAFGDVTDAAGYKISTAGFPTYDL
ncbi:Uma2 family endonuclease [Streptomyces olivoreticuli]